MCALSALFAATKCSLWYMCRYITTENVHFVMIRNPSLDHWNSNRHVAKVLVWDRWLHQSWDSHRPRILREAAFEHRRAIVPQTSCLVPASFESGRASPFASFCRPVAMVQVDWRNYKDVQEFVESWLVLKTEEEEKCGTEPWKSGPINCQVSPAKLFLACLTSNNRKCCIYWRTLCGEEQIFIWKAVSVVLV